MWYNNIFDQILFFLRWIILYFLLLQPKASAVPPSVNFVKKKPASTHSSIGFLVEDGSWVVGFGFVIIPGIFHNVSISAHTFLCQGLGTDEDTLIEILASRTNRQVLDMKKAYKEGMYLKSLGGVSKLVGSKNFENRFLRKGHYVLTSWI